MAAHAKLRFDSPHANTSDPGHGSGLFDRLGRWIKRHALLTVLLWTALAGVLTLLAPSWDRVCHDDDLSFMPASSPSVRGYALLKSAFANEAYGSRLVLVVERADQTMDAADNAILRRLVDELDGLRSRRPDLGIRSVRSPFDPFLGERFRSKDGHCALAVAALETPFLAQRTQAAVGAIESALAPWFAEQRPSPSLALHFSGPAGVGRDLNDAIGRSFHGTTIATVGLVVAVLVLVYRSALLALVPLLTIATAICVSFKILALLAVALGVSVVNVTHVFIVVVLFGVGTDYCLFLVCRCREEADAGGEANKVDRAVGRVGWAITASAGTVICGLGMMGFADFVKLRSTGPALGISLAIALVASLTLAPALLVLLNSHMPRSGALRRQRERASVISDWLIHAMAKRPGWVWLGVMLLLLPFALCGGNVAFEYAVLNELPKDAPSRRGLEAIRRHYPAGEVGPITALIPAAESWTDAGGWKRLAALTQRLASLPNITEVRSLAAPLGKTPGSLDRQGSWADIMAKVTTPLAAGYYLGASPEGQVARFDLILGSDPYTAESVSTLDNVREVLRQEAADHPAADGFGLFGVTPLMQDVATIQERDCRRIYLLVAVCIQAILLLLVRRPLVAIYLFASVLFSYFVTLGLTTLVGPIWLGAGAAALDWKTPFFLFTILIAVGEDYNIFLISRVLEEEKLHGLAEGTCRAVAATGTTITSCGLIMAGTFATLMLGELVSLRQLGLALALGVLLDTFIVRLFLVPSFLLLLARWDGGSRRGLAIVRPRWRRGKALTARGTELG